MQYTAVVLSTRMPVPCPLFHPAPSSSPPICGAVIDAQNKLSGSVLEKCPGRPELEQLITKLMDYPRNHIPFKRGGMRSISTNMDFKLHKFLRIARAGASLPNPGLCE